METTLPIALTIPIPTTPSIQEQVNIMRPEPEVVLAPVPTSTVHSQLKQMTPTERQQLLEQITKEEYQEQQEQYKACIEKEKERIHKLHKACKNDNNNSTMDKGECMKRCTFGKQMNAIMAELRELRIQLQDLQKKASVCQRPVCTLSSISSMPRLNLYGNSNINNINNDYETENDEGGCSILTWMPFWIFLAFVLFIFTSPKPCMKLDDFITKM
uniref:Uncharacterized protein n=1 Tax=viral metagenome TaxID=1070528 RepID=A0A6C0EYC8_9ZZZZ